MVSVRALPLALILLVPATTHAHIALTSPTPRAASQKTGPCGSGNSVRGNNVSIYQPGETITVTWDETVGHPAHYRVSFDEDGNDDFAEPAGYEDYYTNDKVLLDNIPDNAGTGPYSVEVTLPDVECENCTLQLVQVMKDKPPYQVGTNDLYYQCADITLQRDNNPPDAGMGDSGQPPVDAGSPDGGAPPIDAGPPDGGAPLIDAGLDAGTPPLDSGSLPPVDSGQPVVGAPSVDAGLGAEDPNSRPEPLAGDGGIGGGTGCRSSQTPRGGAILLSLIAIRTLTRRRKEGISTSEREDS